MSGIPTRDLCFGASLNLNLCTHIYVLDYGKRPDVVSNHEFKYDDKYRILLENYII